MLNANLNLGVSLRALTIGPGVKDSKIAGANTPKAQIPHDQAAHGRPKQDSAALAIE